MADEIEPGKIWTHVGEYSSEIDCPDPLHTGEYLRRRRLLLTESPEAFWRRIGRRRRGREQRRAGRLAARIGEQGRAGEGDGDLGEGG